jgi:predicted nucleic acid-binding protein
MIQTKYQARLYHDNGATRRDAIQLATALLSGSAALVTHDRDFRDVRDIPILTGG